MMYKHTAALKRDAKDALKGRWKEAVLLNLVPSLLQIFIMFMSVIVIAAAFAFVTNFGMSNLMYEGDAHVAESTSSTLASLTASMSLFSGSPIITFILSFLSIGISFTFLDVLRKGKEQTMSMKEAFRLFNAIDLIPVLLISILSYIFTYLWTLLLVIPGIIKRYAYSQANFIYKDMSTYQDTRHMGATTYITESRQLMDGHKGRLFLLDLSFIGWYIVGILTAGIGLLWINPYVNATKAAFYNDLAKDRYLIVVEEEEEEDWTNF